MKPTTKLGPGCQQEACSPFWNLDGKMDAEITKAKAEYVPPTGTKIEQAREIIRRCEVLEIKLRDQAIEAENAGDHEACWLNMATRAHNQRFLERVRADLQSLKNDPALATRGLEPAPENHAGDGQPSGLPAAHGSDSEKSPTNQ